MVEVLAMTQAWRVFKHSSSWALADQLFIGRRGNLYQDGVDWNISTFTWRVGLRSSKMN